MDARTFVDILAIPFFIGASIYFYNIKNKTVIEWILLALNIFALLVDTVLTISYFSS